MRQRRRQRNFSIVLLTHSDHMLLYLCGEKNQTFFFDLVEVLDKTAVGLMKSLVNCLSHHGIKEDFLDDCFVGFASDGAFTMLGKDCGLVTLLKKRFPKLIVWHCSAHRLQLAVGSTVEDVAGVDHFRMFMDSLYALYHQSSKNQRELEECASSLNEQVKKIGLILDIRWVASSERTLSAVWSSYASLHKHFW